MKKLFLALVLLFGFANADELKFTKELVSGKTFYMTVGNDKKIRELKFGKSTFRINNKAKPLSYKVTKEGYLKLNFKTKRFYKLISKESNVLNINAVKGSKDGLKNRKKSNVYFFYSRKEALKSLENR